MSRFLMVSDGQTRKCAICQSRSHRTSYFRGRYICDDCLTFVKEKL
ncbi:MAG: hypothetical protein J6E42_03825 [Firmicutes bacterium]|nr:hypothetical protein [Bacillota bacterium]